MVPPVQDAPAARRVSPASETATPAGAPSKLIFGLVAAQLGVCTAVFTPIIVTLALRVAQIVPEDGRGAALGKVLCVGALLALVGHPLFGALSDRVTRRFGRRPWLVGGMLVAAGLAIVGLGANVTTLLIGWAIAQLGCNAALCMVTAWLPDHLRGRVSAMVGIMLAVSMMVGSILTQVFTGNLSMAFIVPALVGLGGACVLAAITPDRPARAGAFAPYISRVTQPQKRPVRASRARRGTSRRRCSASAGEPEGAVHGR